MAMIPKSIFNLYNTWKIEILQVLKNVETLPKIIVKCLKTLLKITIKHTLKVYFIVILWNISNLLKEKNFQVLKRLKIFFKITIKCNLRSITSDFSIL